ncbi:uncharacterized protein BCN122_III0897 [Burkholderia cenocepacia]|nr:uncharacterized protein BCN122_III0897 [Burkholderia cenocepacia]
MQATGCPSQRSTRTSADNEQNSDFSVCVRVARGRPVDRLRRRRRERGGPHDRTFHRCELPRGRQQRRDGRGGLEPAGRPVAAGSVVGLSHRDEARPCENVPGRHVERVRERGRLRGAEEGRHGRRRGGRRAGRARPDGARGDGPRVGRRIALLRCARQDAAGVRRPRNRAGRRDRELPALRRRRHRSFGAAAERARERPLDRHDRRAAAHRGAATGSWPPAVAEPVRRRDHARDQRFPDRRPAGRRDRGERREPEARSRSRRVFPERRRVAEDARHRTEEPPRMRARCR